MVAKKTTMKTRAKAKAKTKTTVKAKAKAKTKTKAKAKVTAKVKAAPKATPKVAPKAVKEIHAKTEVVKNAPSNTGAVNFKPYAIQKGEDYMNDAQRDHFRDILLQWKQQLMQEVDSTVVHMKEEALAYADPLDRAAQEEGFNLELRTRDRERKLIKKIEQSLDLLETDDYGYCEDCGAEIGIRRLEARPTAEKCIDCKTFQEIREKQAGG